MKITRRMFLALTGGAAGARTVPQLGGSTGGRRVLTLVYDKSLGMMRAVERVVH